MSFKVFFFFLLYLILALAAILFIVSILIEGLPRNISVKSF